MRSFFEIYKPIIQWLKMRLIRLQCARPHEAQSKCIKLIFWLDKRFKWILILFICIKSIFQLYFFRIIVYCVWTWNWLRRSAISTKQYTCLHWAAWLSRSHGKELGSGPPALFVCRGPSLPRPVPVAQPRDSDGHGRFKLNWTRSLADESSGNYSRVRMG